MTAAVPQTKYAALTEAQRTRIRQAVADGVKAEDLYSQFRGVLGARSAIDWAIAEHMRNGGRDSSGRPTRCGRPMTEPERAALRAMAARGCSDRRIAMRFRGCAHVRDEIIAARHELAQVAKRRSRKNRRG